MVGFKCHQKERVEGKRRRPKKKKGKVKTVNIALSNTLIIPSKVSWEIILFLAYPKKLHAECNERSFHSSPNSGHSHRIPARGMGKITVILLPVAVMRSSAKIMHFSLRHATTLWRFVSDLKATSTEEREGPTLCTGLWALLTPYLSISNLIPKGAPGDQ